MKDEKKVGFVKRIAAGVCVLMLVVGYLGSESFYADTSKFNVFLQNKNQLFCDCNIELKSMPSSYGTTYSNYVLFHSCDSSSFYCFLTNDNSFNVQFRDVSYDGRPAYRIEIYSSVSYYSLDNGSSWLMESSNSYSGLFNIYTDGTLFTFAPYFNSNVPVMYGEQVMYTAGEKNSSGGTYNSSIGYLQNIHRKNLTLDGENYDPDYDSWQVMFSFDSTSTTGLDITTGGYSVRHFMNWEVRDKDSNVIRTYDKVSCGEYDAASCKISYPLYSTRQAAMEECGFEALSWWESSALGYEVYIYDYLQLVRTNADGSIEYGGYVRIDENGYVADTLDDTFTEDSDGYLDQDVPSSNGSGSNYEDAEHDADKNANNSSDSSTDLLSQINLLTSVVKAVPELFMEVFSFLPEWCLDLVGVAFTLSIMITIYKLAT